MLFNFCILKSYVLHVTYVHKMFTFLHSLLALNTQNCANFCQHFHSDLISRFFLPRENKSLAKKVGLQYTFHGQVFLMFSLVIFFCPYNILRLGKPSGSCLSIRLWS